MDKLPKLRLDIDGRLSQTDIEEQLMLAEFEDIFSSIECDTFKIDKTNTCCVCYEKTNTKTLCEHSLCNRCWSKIEINNDEVKKLDVIDYGKINDNSINSKADSHHIFFIGKVVIDNNGSSCFVHLFTLVFSPGEDL